MRIGTVRPEEARVFDSCAGYHTPETGGSIEVFWSDGDAEADMPNAGWYFWACFPGCLPDGPPFGPFATSIAAKCEAIEEDYTGMGY